MKTSPIVVLAVLFSALLVMVIPQNSVEADGELGQQWCIVDRQASNETIQGALNWACSQGDDICLNIQEGKPCYLPNTLEDHASYAFNSYYQKFKSQGATCYFNGAAMANEEDPSYGSCKYEILP
ncbi:glucan endo-1,3-beta-glucosidase 4-like [Papaver somniferum]|uniref:glucan endo-1,3-beta-glucosidase 4-like n=1 Tax=Papaver somniferum TaxID=3469 RepID=UPI000E701942|nr:glucan endo-1,3-beta-glucosidase 4-like [Papaver somniferum]XP_026392879.1 glucan endo-1,3-beta-glucosidase 4-like [Papaver somniferum]